MYKRPKGRSGLFFDGLSMHAYHHTRSGLQAHLSFTDEPSGHTQFRHHLAAHRKCAQRLLVDLPSETLYSQTIPAVGGRDRRALLARLADQHTVATLRSVTVQGREQRAGAAPTERVLIAGIEDPSTLQPWLEDLRASATPLASITSPTLLGGLLLQRLGAELGAVLLLSPQAGGALRQSYYRDGQLHFSRLSPTPVELSPRQHIGAHIEDTLHYLRGQAQLSVDQPLKILALGDLDDPRARTDSTTSNLTPIDLDTSPPSPSTTGATSTANALDIEWISPRRLALDLGLAADTLQASAPQIVAKIFTHLLLSQRRPPPHYASGEWLAPLRLRRNDRLCATAGLVALTLGSALACVDYLASQSIQRQTAALQTALQQQREQLSQQPALPLPSDRIAPLIAALQWRRDCTKTPPLTGVAQLAEHLTAQPQIELLQLNWRSPSDWSHPHCRPQTPQQQTAEPSRDTAHSVAQANLALHGLVRHEGDYRQALNHFSAFIDRLRGDAAQLAIAQAPFDIHLDKNLSGDSQTLHNSANFRLQWLPRAATPKSVTTPVPTPTAATP